MNKLFKENRFLVFIVIVLIISTIILAIFNAQDVELKPARNIIALCDGLDPRPDTYMYVGDDIYKLMWYASNQYVIVGRAHTKNEFENDNSDWTVLGQGKIDPERPTTEDLSWYITMGKIYMAQMKVRKYNWIWQGRKKEYDPMTGEEIFDGEKFLTERDKILEEEKRVREEKEKVDNSPKEIYNMKEFKPMFKEKMF